MVLAHRLPACRVVLKGVPRKSNIQTLSTPILIILKTKLHCTDTLDTQLSTNIDKVGQTGGRRPSVNQKSQTHVIIKIHQEFGLF